MIYRFFGFNILCDYKIEALQKYRRNRLDRELPTVAVLVVNDLMNNIEDGVKVAGDYAEAVLTKQKCCFYLTDGLMIQIVPGNMVLSGDCVNSKRVGEELNGPAMIVLSRFHQRAVLHGSAFLYKGKAYLLLAYSGAGKSTLATAMTKYHSEIDFLTDDIVCVEESGSAIFSGMHSVNLNADSLMGLSMSGHIKNRNQTYMGIDSDKTTCDINLSDCERKHNRIPIGGIIFLDTPLTKGMIQIQKLDILRSFYGLIKNIKLKKVITADLLVQEMDIINRMLCQNIMKIELHIAHDYTKLEQITYELREFIDGYQCS